MPYLVKLPSGRSIAVFFYDAPIAKAVAFEQLLDNGEHFANRLMEAFDDNRNRAQIAHVATDGESYGHHFRYGDMALAYALNLIEKNEQAKLTIYAEFLETISADARGGNSSAQRVELSARRGPVETRLRLQFRRARRLESSNGASRSATRSTGCATNSRRFTKTRRRNF